MTEILNEKYDRPAAKMYVYAFSNVEDLENYLKRHPVYANIADRVVKSMQRGYVALPWRGYKDAGNAANAIAQESYGVDIITPVEFSAMIAQSSPIRKTLGEGYI